MFMFVYIKIATMGFKRMWIWEVWEMSVYNEMKTI